MSEIRRVEIELPQDREANYDERRWFDGLLMGLKSRKFTAVMLFPIALIILALIETYIPQVSISIEDVIGPLSLVVGIYILGQSAVDYQKGGAKRGTVDGVRIPRTPQEFGNLALSALVDPLPDNIEDDAERMIRKLLTSEAGRAVLKEITESAVYEQIKTYLPEDMASAPTTPTSTLG